MSILLASRFSVYLMGSVRRLLTMSVRDCGRGTGVLNTSMVEGGTERVSFTSG